MSGSWLIQSKLFFIKTPMMNEQNKALILQFYKAFDDRHIE
ncbi:MULTISPECIES: hypothetical protein [unclassified Chamaesiphon]|nr:MULTISPECIES: hypothetical protein [unclassified Chamaesiphon]